MDKNTYPKYQRSALLKIARIELLITAMWKNGRKKSFWVFNGISRAGSIRWYFTLFFAFAYLTKYSIFFHQKTFLEHFENMVMFEP